MEWDGTGTDEGRIGTDGHGGSIRRIPSNCHESLRFPWVPRDYPGVLYPVIALGSLKIITRRTYSEGILSSVCTGILCELVHGLEEIADEFILAVVVVCGFFVS